MHLDNSAGSCHNMVSGMPSPVLAYEQCGVSDTIDPRTIHAAMAGLDAGEDVAIKTNTEAKLAASLSSLKQLNEEDEGTETYVHQLWNVELGINNAAVI